MEVDQRVTKRFFADLEELYNMLDFIRDFSRRVFSDVESCTKIELASEEVLVNIIEYAYPNKKGEVMIELEGKRGEMQVIFKDQGPPFDPTKPKPKKHPYSVGGRGLSLIEGAVNFVSYERKGGVNILLLMKKVAK